MMFILYINDISNDTTSSIRLFADDCLLYRVIGTDADAGELQKDLNQLCRWADRWSMAFNAEKCSVLTVTKKRLPLYFDYTIGGTSLEHVKHHPYLGVELAQDLGWGPHLAKVIPKAQRTLNLLRRNLYNCSVGTKDVAYRTMVRPVLEYAACAWDPYHVEHIQKLEAVQRKAARFVTGQYQHDISVTKLMEELEWRSLQERRLVARLAMLKKIQHGQAACEFPSQIQLVEPSVRASHPLQFTAAYSRVDAYLYSFYPRTTRVWNILPLEAVQAKDAATMKEMLNGFFRAGVMYVVPPKSQENRPRLGSSAKVVKVGPVY